MKALSRRAAPALAFVVLALGACASSSTTPSPEARPVDQGANTVTSDELRDRTNMRIEEYLASRVPGLRLIRDQTGQLSFRVRGVQGLSTDAEPLVILDGLQLQQGVGMSVIQQLSPPDILSVKVLKDASDTALYGSRGAAGVVVIRTKRGVSQ